MESRGDIVIINIYRSLHLDCLEWDGICGQKGGEEIFDTIGINEENSELSFFFLCSTPSFAINFKLVVAENGSTMRLGSFSRAIVVPRTHNANVVQNGIKRA